MTRMTEELDSIRQRLHAIEKELHAIKQGAWAGVVRYQQIMDEDQISDINSEFFTDREESPSQENL